MEQNLLALFSPLTPNGIYLSYNLHSKRIPNVIELKLLIGRNENEAINKQFIVPCTHLFHMWFN